MLLSARDRGAAAEGVERAGCWHVLTRTALCPLPSPLCSGTVDPFHLGADLAADWRKQFRWGGRGGDGAVLDSARPQPCLTC